MSAEFEFTSRRSMPIMALRGLSVFPGMLLNFDVERPMSAAALNFAMNADQIIFLAAQKEISKDVPFLDDIYRVGTVCRVRQLLREVRAQRGRRLLPPAPRLPPSRAPVPVFASLWRRYRRTRP